MSTTRTTMASLSREIVTEADAYRHLEGLRWGQTPRCAHCAGTDVYLIPPANGVSRKTAAGTMSERRVWKCRDCKRQFSVLTGTMMHATKVSIRTWILVIFDMMADKNGMSAREVERKYGVTPRTAWHMLHRIRSAMGSENKLLATMRGTIVSDETWVGGLPGRMNAKTRARWEQMRADPTMTDRFSHGSAKTPVLSLVNAETGEIHSRVITRVDGSNIRKVIAEQVDMANSTLWTDEGSWYGPIGREFASHASVNHNENQYVGRGGASTNKLESFFSQLKRSIDGTHHRVSREHLHRYLGEFDFRYATCKMDDYRRMRILVKRMEGRLSYKRLSSV